MKKRNLTSYTLALPMIALLLAVIGCGAPKGSKIPITTSSEEALDYYFQGRDLFDKLRGQESIQYFEKAVAADSNFAMAYLNLSFVQPTAKGFFEKLDKAVALAGRVSEGERLQILGFQAGINAYPMKQREYYRKLVAAYPTDERAHNLLGNHYFAQQEYALAIEEYEKAIEIAPDFSQPYNQLGYAYRFLGNYTEAEKAFKKYIELIPDDPNPFDSYAELLMKMGRYDASIEYYRKALSLNPNFVASHIGIATNLNFKGSHEDARKQLQKLFSMARNDGERRAAYFASAVSYVDEGKMDRALAELEKQYALAEAINDANAMTGDLVNIGNILYEWGKYDEAIAKYKEAVKLTKESDLPQEIKDNTELNFLYNAAIIAMKKKDFSAAKAKAEEYLRGVEAINNPNQIRLAHQLAGMIALEEKNYDRALEELRQANQQNPYNLYRMALAYEGKADKQKAKELYMKTVKFNALNNLNYAFIRNKAQQSLDSM